MLNAFAYFHFRTFCFSILQNKMHLQFAFVNAVHTHDYMKVLHLLQLIHPLH